jgi:putative endonuclease
MRNSPDVVRTCALPAWVPYLSAPHLQLGRTGEQIAREYLERKGLRTIELNWRCAAGELDLVMSDGEILVFVEVKARVSAKAGMAEESISPAKARRLLAAGDWYVSEHPEVDQMIWRIDLVALTMRRDGSVARLTHIENAITFD